MSRHAATGQTNKRKRRGPRALLTVLVLTFAAALLLAATVLIAPLFERVDKTPVSGSADWMARLEDGRPLNALVLPGSHASAARSVPKAFLNKCQALGIGAQLEAGVRLLDLRLRSDGHALLLCHREQPCRASLFGGALTLDELLTQCGAFLDAHPTETVLLAVAPEDGEEVRAFQFLLDAYIRGESERWLLTDTVPTLGEARGRLVLLRRYTDEAGLRKAAGIPLVWADQGGAEDLGPNAAAERQDSFTLYVQDRYTYDVKDKWSAFLAGVHGTEDGAVSVSFLSTQGASSYGHPYEYAKELNARLLEADDAALGGWILTDFISATLAERIYRLNF